MNKLLIVLLSLTSLVGCDRATKIQAVSNLKGQEPLSYFDGMLQLTYHENSGGMLSLGAGLSDEMRYAIFILVVSAILLSALVYILVKPLPAYQLVLGLLVIGGGLGNLYDRAFNDGQVVDFILLVLGPVRTGVFNVADIAIMVGAIGLFITTALKVPEQ